MPLIPALGRQRQANEFKASLVYRVSSRKARTTQRNPVLKQTNKQKQTLDVLACSVAPALQGGDSQIPQSRLAKPFWANW